MDLRAGRARTLYARKQHPRLLLGPEDLPRLRRMIWSGRGRKIFSVLRRRVTPAIERLLAATDVPACIADREHDGDFANTALTSALNIAMVGALADDPRAIEAVRRLLVGLTTCEPLLNYPIFVHGRFYWAVFAYDLLYDRLPPEDRQRFAAYALERHIRFVLADRRAGFLKGAGANLMVDRVLAAIHSALAVRGEPGLPDITPELNELLIWFEAILNTSISSDGYPEEDGGYGTGYLTMIFLAAEALRRSGIMDPLRAAPRLTKAGQMFLHLSPPWGEQFPTTGDCGGSYGMRQHLLPIFASRDRDPSLLWLYGHVKDLPEWEVPLDRAGFCVPADSLTLLTLDLLDTPVHPAKTKHPTQFLDRRRGFVTFRSGWDEEATMVIFDGSQRSPAVQGHPHASCGHFGLFALREYFAVDTGRYNIEQDQHNLVLVDGRSGRSTNRQWVQSFQHGLLIDYAPGPFCDAAAVDSSHQHDCYWARRTLGLVKGAGAPGYVWTVEDINKANDWREFWWTLNTSPVNAIELAGDSAAVVGGRHGHRLDVHFALPDPGEYPKPHTLTLAQDEMAGGSPDYIDQRVEAQKPVWAENPERMLFHSVHLRPRLIAKVAGYNGRFMSVMIPRRKGAAPAGFERLPTLGNALAVRLTFPAVTDTLIYAYEHNLLEADDVVGRGQWCVVRRARRTGRVLACALGHGTRLEVGGKSVLSKLARSPMMRTP